jgi:hypothetical protein
MSTDALKEKLKELHSAIADAGTEPDPRADTELQQLLHQLDGDIRSLLHRPAEKEQGGQSGLASRARSISARFSAEHPTLAPVLRELTDMLSNMGI